MLIVAAVLLILIGFCHSYLGERYILIRLFRRTLPPLFGSDWFTRQTLRFAWHVTTVAWAGMAAILLSIHFRPLSAQRVLQIIAGTFMIHALFPIVATRGRHLSWIVFSAIAILCLLASHRIVAG